ncbi:MAG: DNA translocase FtsK 4TM domain-containing protein [Rickettsiales bacterium]|nr:DNA translocase FtsK 4TM domain-containing protein [Rickettsiales bacterium]
MKFKNSKLDFFSKTQNYLWGTFWIVFSLTIFMSIFSYNTNDISINSVSTSPEIHNILGKFGSYFSDILLQIFGFSSILFAITFLILGTKLLLNKIIYNKWQKIFAFIGLFVSLTISSNIIFASNSCGIEICNGIIGNVIVDMLYYIPQFLLLLFCLLVFFISISFFLDIRRNWWLVKSARIYNFLKASIKNIIKLFSFIFKLFTTKKFRENLKRFFIKIFSKNEANFVLVEDEEEIKIEEKPNQENKNKKDNLIKVIFSRKNKEKLLPEIKTENISKILTKTEKTITKMIGNYVLPNVNLLRKNDGKNKISISKNELLSQSARLLDIMKDFGIKGNMLDVKAGPIITLHEFEPSAGTKSSRVIGLADDIARSMSSISARISVIPGKNAMGIELPNKQREMIYIRDLIESIEYKNSRYPLPMIIGSDIAGEAVIADLSKMPHLLVAGTTGSGKSVAINTMITSLLYKMTPEQCKFIMIDPKMLELSVYEGIPHLLTPVVTEPIKAITALKWVCREMEDRYRIMASLGVRNIAGYNEKLNSAIKEGHKLTRKVQVGFDSETDEPIYEEKEIEEKEMPYIVVIVDEMADLMITAGKEIEASIQRIAQKARAAGIHLIMATQRPSVDVITGVIKANFPTRMSFQVVSKIDSRTILGEQGAEQLLGMGDMLFMAGGGKIIRAHGPFVSDDEVENIVNQIKSQGIKPNYVDEVLKNNDEFSDDESFGGSSNNGMGGNPDLFGVDNDRDFYQQALNIVKKERKCSISYIQRSLRIGYNKAANIVEEMERNGVLSSPNNMGKREILVPEDKK